MLWSASHLVLSWTSKDKKHHNTVQLSVGFMMFPAPSFIVISVIKNNLWFGLYISVFESELKIVLCNMKDFKSSGEAGVGLSGNAALELLQAE